MNAVVRNTLVQGVLSILFVTLAIVVIVAAVGATIRAARRGSDESSEDPAVPSKIFAPAGLVATPAEKELQAQWDALPGERKRGGH
jgi:carbon starvation protein